MDRDAMAKEFYIDDHAVLYALLVKYAEELCGAEGHEAAVKSTRLYARERGLRMAMRCKADGKPLTPNNYLDYGEWVDDRKWSDFRVESFSKDFILAAHSCGWNDSWRKYNLEKYGALYCTWIDRELVKGFNPDNSMEPKCTLTHGASVCRLQFFGSGYESEEEMRKSALVRAELGTKTIKDFLYHTGHILSALRRTYLVELGLEKSTDIVNRALADYHAIFGEEKARALMEESKQDYLKI